MANKRRREEEEKETSLSEPPVKRRKKSMSIESNENGNDDDNTNSNSTNNNNNNSSHNTYQARNGTNSANSGEYACFHFATFRKLPPPHPCLYSKCNNIEFSTWNEWRKHWIDEHRQTYMANNQMIPVTEFNDTNTKIQQSSFHHLNFLTILGSTNATKPKSHCIITFDLSLSNTINEAEDFKMSNFREKNKLIWDPLKYKQHKNNNNNKLQHCNPTFWDRIRSANHCARNVEYFNNSRILFRCGGYYASNQNNIGSDYNKMGNNSLSALCDAFDIDQQKHYFLPNLPEPLHSSSSIYVNELKCLLNIGGDDYLCKPMNKISTLLINKTIKSDHDLVWNENNLNIPNMNIKRSYRPSVGLYKDNQTIKLFVAGGCNTNYDGLKNTESINLTPFIDDNDCYKNIDDDYKVHENNNNKNGKNGKRNIKYKSKWIKQKAMNVPRRDASNLLHWKSQNCMVCCGGDHGEGTVRTNSIKPWYSSEIYDFTKNKWLKLPNFPYETSHAQNPFIWIEGGINDNNYWSGLRETKMFENYSSFDASHGVLCVIGNGFCHDELGNIAFYDPRTNKWQCSLSSDSSSSSTSSHNNDEFWVNLEDDYLGILDEEQELRHISAI